MARTYDIDTDVLQACGVLTRCRKGSPSSALEVIARAVCAESVRVDMPGSESCTWPSHTPSNAGWAFRLPIGRSTTLIGALVFSFDREPGDWKEKQTALQVFADCLALFYDKSQVKNELELAEPYLDAGLSREMIDDRAFCDSEERFKALVDSMDDLVVTLNYKHKVVGVYGKWLNKYHVNPKTLIGITANHIVGEDMGALHEFMLNRTLGGETVAYEWQVLIGEQLVSFHTVLSPMHNAAGSVTAVLGVCRDITDIKRAEQELRKSEATVRAVLSAIPDLVLKIRHDGVIVDANRLENTTHHLPDEDFLGRPIDEVMPQGVADNIIAHMRKAFQTGKLETCIYELDTPNGTNISEARIVPCGHDSVLALVRNVTENRRRESHLKIQTSAIKAASDHVVILNAKGRIEYVNPAFELDTGYSTSDLLGKHISMLRSDEHNTWFYRQLCSTIESGSTWQGEVVTQAKDGICITIDATITPVKNEKGLTERYIVIGRDITERKAYQDHLIQSQKIEMVGRMAAGIAHDFNNLLQGILGYTRILMHRPEMDPSCREDLLEVEQAAVRAADLVRQLMTFSRQVPNRPEPVDIISLAQETSRLLRKTLPRTLRVDCTAAPGCYPALADATQVHQVIMNLCLNARDAMKDGGQITISVDQVTLDDEFVKANIWARSGKYVLCVVSDTGCGMSEDIRKRAFEPFFTTKSPEEGTGLGLSVCYGIVQSHNGFVNIESMPGQGTTVSVYLPVAKGKAVSPPGDPGEEGRRGTETILLVDDEDYITKFGKRLLESVGYSVLVASNGREAVETVANSGHIIDLVLLDLNMPELDGLGALSMIRESHPDMKVIVTTGLDTGTTEMPHDKKPDGLVLKPYKPEVLLRTIRKLFDGEETHC